MTVAALLAYAATALLGAHQGQWAVITCLVVVQASFANTWDASLSRVYGTVAGALTGGAGVLAHEWTGVPEAVMLGLALAPLAALAAVDQRCRLAPVTAGLVMLTVSSGNTAAQLVLDRITEIVLGVTVGVLCTLLVLPERAHAALRRHAADALDALGEIAQAHITLEGAETYQLRMDEAFTRAQAATTELTREKALGLVKGPPPQPFMTALRRLRTDVALIERAMAPGCRAANQACLANKVEAWFTEAAAALRTGCAIPEPITLDPAFGGGKFDALGFALTALRREQSDFCRRAEQTVSIGATQKRPVLPPGCSTLARWCRKRVPVIDRECGD